MVEGVKRARAGSPCCCPCCPCGAACSCCCCRGAFGWALASVPEGIANEAACVCSDTAPDCSTASAEAGGTVSAQLASTALLLLACTALLLLAPDWLLVAWVAPSCSDAQGPNISDAHLVSNAARLPHDSCWTTISCRLSSDGCSDAPPLRNTCAHSTGPSAYLGNDDLNCAFDEWVHLAAEPVEAWLFSSPQRRRAGGWKKVKLPHHLALVW